MRLTLKTIVYNSLKNTKQIIEDGHYQDNVGNSAFSDLEDKELNQLNQAKKIIEKELKKKKYENCKIVRGL